MMGFGGELLLFTGLGFVILGPKQMNALLKRLAKVKAEFDKVNREIKSQLEAKLEEEGQVPGNEGA
jgi:Sec-independent protein translocase protein TatA